MKAVLLIAGLGTRLRPLTDTVPKCLLPINGKPLLGIWFDKLVAAGVSDVLVNTHWLADQVTDYIDKQRALLSLRLPFPMNSNCSVVPVLWPPIATFLTVNRFLLSMVTTFRMSILPTSMPAILNTDQC